MKDADFDATEPIVDIKGMKRGCPECFSPVDFVRTDQDRRGLYEIWECTEVTRLAGHVQAEDPHDGTLVGRYIVRESHYSRSFRRRGKVRLRREKQAAKS